MVKISNVDIIAILKRFDAATDDHKPRHIEQVKYFNPEPNSTLVSFKFGRQHFYILYDNAADDDKRYVLEAIKKYKPDARGNVLVNPQDHHTTYALPFKGKEIYLFQITTDKKRLDVILSTKYPDEFSRSTWQKYIKSGYVSVNGKVETSPKADVTDTDALAVAVPPKKDYTQSELPILYIDDNVIVIDKPAGVLTHSKGALNDEFTVADFFRRYTSFGLTTNRPGIVHRLDRDTSGVMIGARNEAAADMLKKQFSNRKTKKTYLAVVKGRPKNDKAKIDLPIGRNPAAPSTFRIDLSGKSAVTYYSVLSFDGKTSLVKLEPITGRTHQLRIHMLSIGTPILGDRIYDKPAERLYLHAESLEITVPSSDRRVFRAVVPSEFKELYLNEDNS